MRLKGGYRSTGSRRTALAVSPHGDTGSQATLAFLRFCLSVPPPENAFADVRASNMTVPVAIVPLHRARAPSVVCAELLADLPLLITEGTEDAIVPPDATCLRRCRALAQAALVARRRG